jgi:hypothetical protein
MEHKELKGSSIYHCENFSIHNTSAYFLYKNLIDEKTIFLAQECKTFTIALLNHHLWLKERINGGYNCTLWNTDFKKYFEDFDPKTVEYKIYDEDGELLINEEEKKESSRLEESLKEEKSNKNKPSTMIIIYTKNRRYLLLNRFETR